MKNLFIPLMIVSFIAVAFIKADINMQIQRSFSIDSLGACQGASFQRGKLFLYGDREVGMIREYKMEGDSITNKNSEIKLTIDGKDVINHPTGIAVHDKMPTFIGNSIRLNPQGTLWKAVIYSVDWERLQTTKTLDGNLLNTIEDDTCIQGTRPEYVKYKNKWYVATADYGNNKNEVRLYDPVLLAKAKKTSEKNVLYKKFTCTPWVQNLQWIPEKNILVLIQNQIEGRKWRFTYVDFIKSIESGKQEVIKVIDIDERSDELEGFTFLNDLNKGVAVSSSKRNNVNIINIKW
jgi:hypothetical protein